MKHSVIATLLGTALLSLAAAAAGADELTVNSILSARNAGAPNDGLVAMVNNPNNTIGMTAGDLITLRNAGVSETVIAAIWARIPAPPPASVPLQPDDARLVDFVRLINSGVSTPIIAEQVRQSGQAYNLSVNDLLYLKQNGAQESTIAALMATGTPAGPAVAPAELNFDDLVLIRTGFWKKDRTGRLVMRGDTLAWEDGSGHSDENFTFQTTGLEKVWFTCRSQAPENFCYQINFQIIKGDRYRFRDSNRESGSNVAVTRIMDALRKYDPRLTFGPPDT